MKVTIEAASQEEFDAKRPELVKALVKKVRGTVYDQERPALEPRRAPIRAQNEMLEFWSTKYRAMIAEIKKEVADVLHQG